MKYYLYSACLIITAVIAVLFIPLLIQASDNFLASFQIPHNNAVVAGIQKYNIPPVSRNLPLPNLSARAVLIKDLGTGTILFQKDANISYPIASTTKIITALVASEHFKQNSILTVGKSASTPGSKVGLTAGENLSFRSLLYGMLLNSGNDAAFAISENYLGGTESFVAAMNKKADALGLKNTRFDNPAGFDSPKHFSSAYDLAVITQEALKSDVLKRIFSTKETSIVSLNKKYSHQLINLNKLLSEVKGVMGVKTGTTQEAKENLVTLVERENHNILIVLLGSDDRFSETRSLIDWSYENFHWSE